MNLRVFYKAYQMLGQGRLRFFCLKCFKLLGLKHYVVRMDLKMACNLRCPSCHFSGKDFREDSTQMPLENFKKIAAEIFPKTRLLFLSCSAEPLTVKNFEHYLDVCGQYRFSNLTFTTNGMLLKESHVESCIKNRVNEICFSIDGSKKETVEKLRKGAKFETIIENIKMLNRVKEKRASTFPAARFNFVMSTENIDEVVDFVRLVSELKGDYIVFRHFIDMGGEMGTKDCSLAQVPEHYNEVQRKASSLAKELGIEILMPQPFSLKKESKPKKPKVNLKKYGCANPWFMIYLHPNGAYRPCTYLPFEGNVLETSFQGHQKLACFKKRKADLIHDVENSCMKHGCQGKIMERVNDDSNFLDEE